MANNPLMSPVISGGSNCFLGVVGSAMIFVNLMIPFVQCFDSLQTYAPKSPGRHYFLNGLSEKTRAPGTTAD